MVPLAAELLPQSGAWQRCGEAAAPRAAGSLLETHRGLGSRGCPCTPPCTLDGDTGWGHQRDTKHPRCSSLPVVAVARGSTSCCSRTGWEGDARPARSALRGGCIPPHKGPPVCPISAIIKNQLVSYREQTQPRQGLAEGLRGPRPPCPPPAPGSAGVLPSYLCTGANWCRGPGAQLRTLLAGQLTLFTLLIALVHI